MIESHGLLKKKLFLIQIGSCNTKLQAVTSGQSQKQKVSKLIEGEPNNLFKTFHLFQ